MEFTGKRPTSADLMATLIELLADQESCKIVYSIMDEAGNIIKKEGDEIEKNWIPEMEKHYGKAG